MFYYEKFRLLLFVHLPHIIICCANNNPYLVSPNTYDNWYIYSNSLIVSKQHLLSAVLISFIMGRTNTDPYTRFDGGFYRKSSTNDNTTGYLCKQYLNNNNNNNNNNLLSNIQDYLLSIQNYTIPSSFGWMSTRSVLPPRAEDSQRSRVGYNPS